MVYRSTRPQVGSRAVGGTLPVNFGRRSVLGGGTGGGYFTDYTGPAVESYAVAMFQKACGVLVHVSRVTPHRPSIHTAPRVGQGPRPQMKMCQVLCFPITWYIYKYVPGVLSTAVAVTPARYLQHRRHQWSDAQRPCCRYTNPVVWASSTNYDTRYLVHEYRYVSWT